VKLAYTYVLAGGVGATEPPDKTVQTHLDQWTAAGWKLIHYTSNTYQGGALLHNFIWAAEAEEDRPARSEVGH
jgi:hypothetical protein